MSPSEEERCIVRPVLPKGPMTKRDERELRAPVEAVEKKKQEIEDALMARGNEPPPYFSRDTRDDAIRNLLRRVKALEDHVYETDGVALYRGEDPL